MISLADFAEPYIRQLELPDGSATSGPAYEAWVAEQTDMLVRYLRGAVENFTGIELDPPPQADEDSYPGVPGNDDDRYNEADNDTRKIIRLNDTTWIEAQVTSEGVIVDKHDENGVLSTFGRTYDELLED